MKFPPLLHSPSAPTMARCPTKRKTRNSPPGSQINIRQNGWSLPPLSCMVLTIPESMLLYSWNPLLVCMISYRELDELEGVAKSRSLLFCTTVPLLSCQTRTGMAAGRKWRMSSAPRCVGEPASPKLWMVTKHRVRKSPIHSCAISVRGRSIRSSRRPSMIPRHRLQSRMTPLVITSPLDLHQSLPLLPC